ncbi:MAG: DUF411 domain-containing protein, partial [Paracoccus sp. (in: a-proteobacteria)]|uniref:DUF411 domain-containing protein n=1 Tax=Paracoccus sp. TaxID=267 RepID=UPI0032423930
WAPLNDTLMAQSSSKRPTSHHSIIPAWILRKIRDRSRPDALGLAVPGMPIGSPGMEMGDQTEPFEVILWTGTGTNVFARY